MEKELTLLIVDDEEALIHQLQLVFENDYKLLTARSADEALQIVEEHHFDICLSDMKMPGSTGLDLAKSLALSHPHAPFILMTGHGDRESLLKFLRLGIFDWVDKPFELHVLCGIVERAAKVVHQHREYMAQERRNVGQALVVSYNHHIRNPLMIATGYLERVKSEIDSVSYEKMRDALQRIQKLLADMEETVTISVEFDPYVRAEKMIRLQSQQERDED